MQRWRVTSAAVGGVAAVGFLDEERLIAGSHSGVGVFLIRSGERCERIYDDRYGWYNAAPPSIRYPVPGGVRLIRAAGLWGGELDQATADGWSCRRTSDGAVLSAAGQPDFRIEDSEEFRAQGFSPGGRAYVCATSPTVHLACRQ